MRWAVLLLSLLTSFVWADKPSILWVCVDDMSDWMGCYGDKTVPTPHIDGLAAQGVRFDRVYMPAPVCSATRSALITGTMQTSHGLHHHRTMIKKPLPKGIVTVPELFRAAGYLTFNEAKDDYNFKKSREQMYSPEFVRPKKRVKSHLEGTDLSWLEQLKGKTFFGQIQLKGGKIGGEAGQKYPTESRVDPATVNVPPYYPDDPVVRNGIARHYEQIAQTDEQVGAILAALDAFGLSENTIVFFFTDHGSPLARDKQFLYEGGTKVPLIVRGVGNAGTVRKDLVNGIDISATSLALAGIEMPEWIEGLDLFVEAYQPRKFVVSARDRCGNAIDRIRAVRTEHFRYIRNYLTDRALYEPQYRSGGALFTRLRELRDAGKLGFIQASYFDASQRSEEELYDLRLDPHQINNLAGEPGQAGELARHRLLLEQWEVESGDQGGLPESKASLRLVFRSSKGRCVNPEYEFIVKEQNNLKAPHSPVDCASQ